MTDEYVTKNRLASLTLALVLTSCTAEPKNEIEFVCCSWHHNRSADYNEFQAGVLYRREMSDRWGFVAGTFRNSNDRQSFLAGATYSRPVTDWMDVGITVGAITGYSLPITPAAIPEIRVGRVRVYTIPGVVYVLGITVLKW